MVKLNELSIISAHSGLINKKFTCSELVQACLDRIADRDEKINAFLAVDDERALERAEEVDNKIKNGEKIKLLEGIPFAVKDAICTKDINSTASAKVLDNYIPAYNATVIQKLLDQGAIIIGKNNCDGFGHGASNENSHYGPVRNPYDLSRVAGGSSGGTAAAVADNMCIFGIGEDTGGSIRQPASFCGIYGLRPTYGRNSRYGIMPMASSLDTVGPMAKTREDIAILEEVMAGVDKLDATTVPAEVPRYSEILDSGVKGLRIGLPKEYFELEGLDSEVREIVLDQIEKLKQAGAIIKEISLPYTKYAIPVYYIIVPSEDSSNLVRFDGVRYGVRKEGKNLLETYLNSRTEGFPDEVKRRIMIGTYALSAGYYDAYYKKAQKVRTLIINDFNRAFEIVDVIITPTAPTTAFKIGEKTSDPLQMYLADVFVGPAAVAGLPGLNIPVGKDKNGLPVGMQAIGPRLGEETILRINI